MIGLLDLPLEVVHMIGLDVKRDIDLENFRRTCHFVNDAVDGDGDSFWRRRFLERYDLPSVQYRPTNKVYKRRYLQRVHCLKRRSKYSGFNRNCLMALRDLVVESFIASARDIQTPPVFKNMSEIDRFVARYGFLDTVLASRSSITQQDPLLLALQLTLTYKSLNANPVSVAAGANQIFKSQHMAYLSPAARPIFDSTGQIDLEWSLHVASFWKQLFCDNTEHLYDHFQALEDHQRPKGWSKKLEDGPQKLGKFWKGNYAYIDQQDVDIVRSGANDELIIQDHSNGEDSTEGFQSLTLEFPETDDAAFPWPNSFEKILKSHKLIHRGKTRAQTRATGSVGAPTGEPLSFRFQGKGSDNDDLFLSTGWLNPLPPQQGIPGWQRLTMMKYYVHEGSPNDSPVYAKPESMWAYEGVVLPGGNIIMGRWWYPHPDPHVSTDDQYSGPFILWNVQGDEI